MTWLLALSLAANVAILLGFLRDRKNDRDFWGELLTAEKADRQMLLNRIQAPQVAIAQTSPEPSEEPVYVSEHDDERFWDTKPMRMPEAERTNGDS